MLQVISDSSFNELLFRSKEKAFKYGEPYNSIIQALYFTGARVSEILEHERWTTFDVNHYKLATTKTGEIRFINKWILSDYYKNRYLQQSYYQHAGYDTLNSIIKNIMPRFLIYEGKNFSYAHAFRYGYMKRLKADGLTMQQIKNDIGHLSLETTIRYVKAEIILVTP